MHAMKKYVDIINNDIDMKHVIIIDHIDTSTKYLTYLFLLL